MGLKDRLKRLARGPGGLASFVLTDGNRYYFDPKSGELFLHAAACLRADFAGRGRPAPPATLLALCKARDRAAAIEKIATRGLFPYEVEAIVERGVLVERSMVARSREDFSE